VCPGPIGKLIHPARDEIVGNITVRNVLFQATVETVGDREIGNRAGKYRSVEDRRSIIDQLGTRVADEEGEPARESLFPVWLGPHDSPNCRRCCGNSATFVNRG
jgi:hypothetical protein